MMETVFFFNAHLKYYFLNKYINFFKLPDLPNLFTMSFSLHPGHYNSVSYRVSNTGTKACALHLHLEQWITDHKTTLYVL